jgi:hypothetical protein
MKWTTWSGTEAVGTGTYKINDCTPSCAAGHVYSVATVVTLSRPAKVCSASGAHRVWSHASFSFPERPARRAEGPERAEEPVNLLRPRRAAQQSCVS